MTVCEHFSQRSTCPPSAAVRQRSIADITLSWPRLNTAGIGRAPRRPVVAEDIRDLQLRTGHCGGLRRRLLRAARLCARLRGFLLRLFGLPAWLCQHVERALDVGAHAGGDTGIARCRIELLMPQERLDDSDIGAALEKVRRKAVA